MSAFKNNFEKYGAYPFENIKIIKSGLW